MKKIISKHATLAARGRDLTIAGVGASAGALDSFKKFFSTMPVDSSVAFVLIQHLDPTHESHAAELVGAYTRMQVTQVADGMRVEPNCVYIIPPNKYLSIRRGVLHLSPPSEPRSLRMAIDFFFRSLAADRKERAIGVILSGTGSDGTLGMKEIKAAGGLTMAQTPATAQHSGMPSSAIASGSVDCILPVEQLAKPLVAFVQHPYISLAGDHPAPETFPDSLASVVALLHIRTKFDFSGYKTGTLRRRIGRRMSLRQIDRAEAYIELLRSDPGELNALHRDLLIHVTSFFRDPAAWKVLQERVVRPLVAAADPLAPLRAWVPACATGEEAYSLTILLLEELQAAKKSCPLQVFASDVASEGLEAARTGIYPEGIAAQVSPERLQQFFTRVDRSYQVRKELRDVLVFAPQNILSDPPFSRIDLISCRNLLIYLEPTVQHRVVTLLHFALNSGGHLFLGSAEGVGMDDDLFEPLAKKYRIYRRVGPPRADRLELPLASGTTATALQTTVGQRLNLRAGRLANLAQQLLLERYAPASMIITRAHEILYYHGQIDEYLVHPSGAPTHDVIAKVRSELRSKLRGALHEALRTDRGVVVDHVPLRTGKGGAHVRLAVEPLDATREVEGLWLVSFELERETSPSPPLLPATAGNPMGNDTTQVQKLEDALGEAREDLELSIEDLRATNEELLSVNEELQSSNEELETSREELMSLNEELQSSNEELETSKSELMSLNEELNTSNADLASKVLELEASNNDLDNLLSSTNVATIFLDTQQRIRRFTPNATRLFSLIKSDIGRPIGDIAQKFVDPSLLTDVAATLRTPTSATSEIQTQDGQWFLRQVLPYRTCDNIIEGVVITFSDIAAEALQKARHYAESIVDTVREPLLVLDSDLRVRSASRSFFESFKSSPKETVGKLVYDLNEGEWDIPTLRTLLGQILPRELAMNDLEIRHDFKSIGPRVMLLNARAITRDDGRPEMILLAIDDITERTRARQLLHDSESLKKQEEQLRQRQAELAHALRISTIGEIASNLAHELNQPLSSIANRVEACMGYVRAGMIVPAKLLTLLEDASSEALRAGSIVEHLRSFIQEKEARFEAADLREIARGIPRLLGRELQQEKVDFQLDSGSSALPILADRIQIEQIILNLVQNSIDAMRSLPSERRTLRLSTRAVDGMAELMVTDSGSGLPAEATKKLFEPFFTTKPHGLGMGLAISRSIIEAHGGRIWVVCPTDGRAGTTLSLNLPLKPPHTARKRVSK